jgi:hypothetical protein
MLWYAILTLDSLSMIRYSGWIIALPIVLTASSLNAQQIGATDFQKRQTPTVTWNGKDVPLRENLISINPLGIVFEYFSGEFEHAVTRSTSLALSASYASPFDFTYTSVDAIGRYYPAEQGLRGFSIGPTVGYTHVVDNQSCFGSCGGSPTTNAFTLGIQFDYSWILGPSQHFGIELGLGAKRLFYQKQAGGGSDALPTARLSVGYSF